MPWVLKYYVLVKWRSGHSKELVQAFLFFFYYAKHITFSEILIFEIYTTSMYYAGLCGFCIRLLAKWNFYTISHCTAAIWHTAKHLALIAKSAIRCIQLSPQSSWYVPETSLQEQFSTSHTIKGKKTEV